MREVTCSECHRPYSGEPVRPTDDDGFVHVECFAAFAQRTALKPWAPEMPRAVRSRWRKRSMVR